MMIETPTDRGPVYCCSYAQASPPGHGGRRGQQVHRMRTRQHNACPLSTMEACKPRDGLSWLLVMSRHYTSLLTLGSRAATSEVVEVRRGLAWEPTLLPKVWRNCRDRARPSLYPRGRGRWCPHLRGQAR
jgi:hypothetical protein